MAWCNYPTGMHTSQKITLPLSTRYEACFGHQKARLDYSDTSARNSVNLGSHCQDSKAMSIVSVCTDTRGRSNSCQPVTLATEPGGKNIFVNCSKLYQRRKTSSYLALPGGWQVLERGFCVASALPPAVENTHQVTWVLKRVPFSVSHTFCHC